jgi:hypothetical protein
MVRGNRVTYIPPYIPSPLLFSRYLPSEKESLSQMFSNTKPLQFKREFIIWIKFEF